MAARKTGRPRKYERRPNLIDAPYTVAFAVDGAIVDRVDHMADNLNVSRSEILRRAVAEYLAAHPETPQVQEALIAS